MDCGYSFSVHIIRFDKLRRIRYFFVGVDFAKVFSFVKKYVLDNRAGIPEKRILLSKFFSKRGLILFDKDAIMCVCMEY